MQTTRFGNTGLNVSRFVLGTMTFSRTVEPELAGRIVDDALDHGVNFIDTADSYGDSEAFLGDILTPDKRDRVFLATKVYKQFCRDGNAARNSRTNIRHNVERSLEKLKTDYLDLFKLHHPDPHTPVEETLRILDTLVQHGKIRYWGVSNHYAWQMSYMLGLSRGQRFEPMVSVQSAYSILERQLEREQTPMMQRFNIALMCYSPLCAGILTGKYHPEHGDPEPGRADQQELFGNKVKDPEVAHIVHGLRPIAKAAEMSMNQLALAWLLAKPHATTIILGGNTLDHFRSAYAIADKPLPPDLVQQIDDLSASRVTTDYFNQPIKEGFELNVNS